MIAIGFCAAAAAGTLGRYWFGLRLPAPLGTLSVNLLGSLLLGVLHGRGTDAQTVLGLAALGSFTTFSTLALELAEFWPENWRRALVYGATSIIGGVGLAWIGLRLS